jgi:hypothetical protein
MVKDVKPPVFVIFWYWIAFKGKFEGNKKIILSVRLRTENKEGKSKHYIAI